MRSSSSRSDGRPSLRPVRRSRTSTRNYGPASRRRRSAFCSITDAKYVAQVIVLHRSLREVLPGARTRGALHGPGPHRALEELGAPRPRGGRDRGAGGARPGARRGRAPGGRRTSTRRRPSPRSASTCCGATATPSWVTYVDADSMFFADPRPRLRRAARARRSGSSPTASRPASRAASAGPAHTSLVGQLRRRLAREGGRGAGGARAASSGASTGSRATGTATRATCATGPSASRACTSSSTPASARRRGPRTRAWRASGGPVTIDGAPLILFHYQSLRVHRRAVGARARRGRSRAPRSPFAWRIHRELPALARRAATWSGSPTSSGWRRRSASCARSTPASWTSSAARPAGDRPRRRRAGALDAQARPRGFALRGAGGASRVPHADVVAVYGATGSTGRMVLSELARGTSSAWPAGATRRLRRSPTAAGRGRRLRGTLASSTRFGRCSRPRGRGQLRGPARPSGRPRSTRGDRTTWTPQANSAFIRVVFERFGPEAERHGVALVPALGFDYALGDCLARLAATGHEPLRELVIAYAIAGSGVSGDALGAAAERAESGTRSSTGRRAGGAAPAGSAARQLPLPRAARPQADAALRLGRGDHRPAPHPDATGDHADHRRAPGRRTRVSPAFVPVPSAAGAPAVRRSPLRPLLGAGGRAPGGRTNGPANGRFTIAAVATGQTGRRGRALVEGRTSTGSPPRAWRWARAGSRAKMARWELSAPPPPSSRRASSTRWASAG